jgi:hypothetical protein
MVKLPIKFLIKTVLLYPFMNIFNMQIERFSNIQIRVWNVFFLLYEMCDGYEIEENFDYIL